MCKRQAKRYGLIFGLWCLFTICCLAAPLMALAFPFVHRSHYLRRFVKTADRLVAAMLGFSGRFTLSVEVATSTRYTRLRDILNMVEDRHCENEVFDEGAYCRLSDHQLGDK